MVRPRVFWMKMTLIYCILRTFSFVNDPDEECNAESEVEDYPNSTNLQLRAGHIALNPFGANVPIWEHNTSSISEAIVTEVYKKSANIC